MIEGCPHGEGILIQANGDHYKGFFEFGKRKGQGICKYRNEDEYEG